MSTESAGPSRADVLAMFDKPAGVALRDDYLTFHAERIAFLLGVIEPYVAAAQQRNNGPARILDVGVRHLTFAMSHYFGRRVVIDTLGFPGDPFVTSAASPDRHIGFDLNNAQEPARWVPGVPHDVVTFAEVLEHLYTAPQLVLRFLATFVANDGVMVIQTPNAVALGKRIRLLIGRQPFELIRETPNDPGHFREYTVGELRTLCDQAGLSCLEIRHTDYWAQCQLSEARALGKSDRLRSTLATGAVRVAQALQDRRSTLRNGITIVAERAGR